jgi:hypothetical protein
MQHGSYRRAWLRAALYTAMIAAGGVGALYVAKDERFFLVGALVAVIATLVIALNDFLRVSVGADGIRLRRLLAGPRFVPFSALQSAETDGRDVTLLLRDGEVVRLHHPGGKGAKPLVYADRSDEGRLLVERIKAQAAEHGHVRADLQALARGRRETREWLRDVAVASDEHASFRSPAIPPDELWREPLGRPVRRAVP